MAATKGMSVFVHNGTEYNINDPNVANEFDSSTSYAAGDYVFHAGKLYRFTSAHAAGDWDGSQVARIFVGDEMTGIGNGMDQIQSDLAPTFSSSATYVAGEYCTRQRILYRFTQDHSGAWNSSHVVQANIGDVLETAVRGIATAISNDNKAAICGGSCDGLPNNTYYCVGGGVTLTNQPFTTYYGILTVGKSMARSAADFQIATRVSDGTTKIRTYYNADNGWGAWKDIPDGALAFTGANASISNDNKAAICGGDCDNIPNNMYYGVGGDTELTHQPVSSNFYCIATFGKYSTRSSGDFQLATQASNGTTWIRTYHNTNGWTPWRPIPNGALTFVAGNGIITASNKASLCGGDCDNIQNNTYYGVDGAAGLSHEPFTNAFYSVATFGKYVNRSAGDFQLATRASDGATKIRTYYNAESGWSDWAGIADSSKTFTAGAAISDDNKAEICGGDCNGIPNNTFYGVGGTTVLDHAPVSGSFYSIATFGKNPTTNRTAGDLQIASDTYNGRLLYRNYINTTSGWTPWKKVQETITDEAVYSGIGMFQKFGVIGDSFASGPILPGTADPLNQNFSLSWGQIMARKAGVTCVNYSEGGCGTYRFLDTTHRDYSTHLMGKLLADIDGGDKCGLYLLCFGINDSNYNRIFGNKHGGLEYLGSSADINMSDYTQNENSFWGNYGKIIQQLKQLTPDSRLVMCTYWRENNSEDYAYNEYIEAIQQIAAFFEIPCLTLTDDSFFTSSFYINNLVSNHPTAPQYVGYAAAIDRLLSRSIVSNYNYFKGYTALP